MGELEIECTRNVYNNGYWILKSKGDDSPSLDPWLSIVYSTRSRPSPQGY